VQAGQHDDRREEHGDTVIRRPIADSAGAFGRRGQALVEFALVIPIFLVLLFAIVDAARYVYSSNALNEIAREAGRQGTVARRPAECAGLDRASCVRTLVVSRVTAVNVPPDDITVVCYRIPHDGTPPSDGDQPDNCLGTWQGGDLVRVRIVAPFTLVTPFGAQILSPTLYADATWITVNG
jgi:hypothetical protein